MIAPETAHVVDGRILLSTLVGVTQADLPDVRREFARYLTTPAARNQDPQTWQAAWNQFTGATPARRGSVRYTPHRCGACHGRRYNARTVGRNISRTGSPYVCGECRGTGRGTPTTATVRYLPPPVDAPQEQP